MKKCICCGKEHKNRTFCSRSCNMIYHNKHRIITEKWIKRNSESKKGIGHKQKDETKIKISNSLKKYLKNNPDKHNWVTNKNRSKPCEHLKENLKNRNIFYMEEVKPLNDYNFSVDIVIPEYKIGIEVNGNQHYKKDSNDLILDDYYQKRHDLIEKDGWKIIELHYKTIYDKNINDIINKILEDREFHYDINTKNYIINCLNRKKICKICGNEMIQSFCENCNNVKNKKKEEKKEETNRKKILKMKQKEIKLLEKIEKNNKYDICKCGNRKMKISEYCNICHGIKNRKVERPSYEVLKNDIKILGLEGTGRKYKVSGNAVKKWMKK